MAVMPGPEGDLLRHPEAAKGIPKPRAPLTAQGADGTPVRPRYRHRITEGVSQGDGPALTEPSPQSMPRLPQCVRRPRTPSGPTRNVNATGTEHHPSPDQPSAQQHRPQDPSWPGRPLPAAATSGRGSGVWALRGHGCGLACRRDKLAWGQD